MEIIEVKFAPNQKLPEGYCVAWYECDEHFRWVIGELDNPQEESVAWATKWQAKRSAIAHFESQTIEK